MIYTNLTLGELLSNANETIKRNAVSILKVLQGKKDKEKELDEYSCSCNEGGKTENHVFWSIKDYRERGNPVCPFCDADMYLV